jgi:hypothetical protein
MNIYRSKIVCTRPISHSRMHFRDLLWKDEIFIEHIPNLKEYSSHVGVCMCTHEPKMCVYEPIEVYISEIVDEKTRHAVDTTNQNKDKLGLSFANFSSS